MKKYFYSDGKEKFGPLSLEELKNQNINPESLIWFEGLIDWTPVKEISELKELIELIPPPIIFDDSKTKFEGNDFQGNVEQLSTGSDIKSPKINITYKESIELNHPWRRLLARTIDWLLGGILMVVIFSAILNALMPEVFDSYLKILENPIGAGFIMSLLWIPIEAILLSTVSTTLGKWLFGIYVKRKNEEKLSFYEAISRAFQEFLIGEGLGIQPIPIFTRLYAYGRLVKKGITVWDSNVGSIIIYEKWTLTKKVLSIIVFILTLIIFSIINSTM